MVSLEPRIGLDSSYCAQKDAGYVEANKYQREPTAATRTSFCRVGAYSGRLSHHCRRLVNRETATPPAVPSSCGLLYRQPRDSITLSLAPAWCAESLCRSLWVISGHSAVSRPCPLYP